MRKKDVQNVEDVEKYYSQARKVRFADDTIIRNVKQIKRKLFETSPKTVGNRGGYHCEIDKQRSIDDYIILSKTYFPNKSVKEILSTLIKDEKFKTKKGLKKIWLRYCPNIRKTNVGGLHYNISYYQSGFVDLGYNKKIILGFPNNYTLDELTK